MSLTHGHVPVRLEAGETRIKKSGRAITIDRAFAADIAPTVSDVADVAVYERPRTVSDAETGDEIRAEIAVLEEPVRAFEAKIIREHR